jgi:2-polyprenyl-3-methyl-5-hydroxy-6-metoxy-1,4-benzoquinol methylase
MSGTAGDDYARRLATLEGARWKRVLNVQAPYRWNLRRRQLGRTLEVGCGIGRNLATLGDGSIGIDHNPASVEIARQRGFTAYTVEEWQQDRPAAPESFDSLLVAHVVEHLTRSDARSIMNDYLPFLRPGGKVLFICPQEKGYASDATHISWTTGSDLEQLSRDLGLRPDGWTSFPFPRFAGRYFTYNEFNVVAHKA